MPTLTKPRKKKATAATNGQANGHALCKDCGWDPLPLRRAVKRALEAVNLDPEKVDPSPFQPRQSFPDDEIQQLAESIANQGQLAPILVRRVGDRWELLEGERRLRAIKRLGYDSIRAEVGDFTDAEARAIVLVSALQKKDLNAIEEAIAFRRALDAGDAPGPTELARQLGLSQGHVSNRLRLLELPEPIKKRVISREIPATHAREIVPFAKHPSLVQAIVKEIDLTLKRNEDVGPLEWFRTEVVSDAVTHATEAMDGDEYVSKACLRVPIFTPTDVEREQLGLIEVPSRWDHRKNELRATNVKLWKKLQAKHAAEYVKTHKAGEKTKASAKAAKKAKPAKPAELTPAQRKQLEAEERKRREEADRRTANRVWELWIDWQRRLVAAAIVEGLADEPQRLRLAVYFLACEEAWHMQGSRRQNQLLALLTSESISIGQRKSGYINRPAIMAAVADLVDPAPVITDFLAAMFWADNQPQPCCPPADVQAAAELLEIDLEAAWKREQLGPLTEAYWDAHTKDQLAALGKELGVYIEEGKPKSVAVKLLAHQQRALPMPKELKKPKRPK